MSQPIAQPVSVDTLKNLLRRSDRLAIVGSAGSGAGTLAGEAMALVGSGLCRSVSFATSVDGIDADVVVLGAIGSPEDAESTARALGLIARNIRLLPPMRFFVLRHRWACHDGGHERVSSRMAPLVA